MEEHVTPKLVPLTLPKIGVSIEVTLIDNVTHASEVFRTLDIVLKDTPIMEKLYPQPIPLCEFVDTTCEQHVNDLATRIK